MLRVRDYMQHFGVLGEWGWEYEGNMGLYRDYVGVIW